MSSWREYRKNYRNIVPMCLVFALAGTFFSGVWVYSHRWGEGEVEGIGVFLSVAVLSWIYVILKCIGYKKRQRERWKEREEQEELL